MCKPQTRRSRAMPTAIAAAGALTVSVVITYATVITDALYAVLAGLALTCAAGLVLLAVLLARGATMRPVRLPARAQLSAWQVGQPLPGRAAPAQLSEPARAALTRGRVTRAELEPGAITGAVLPRGQAPTWPQAAQEYRQDR
jgi:hypothetical protein